MTDVQNTNAPEMINMMVPEGEPCGCQDERGCFDTMYCSCDCYACLIERRVFAGLTCASCKKGDALFYVDYPDINGDMLYGQRICKGCFKIYCTHFGVN